MAAPSGKTALITGASAGIGRDLAQCFARDGHNLFLIARSAANLQKVAGDLSSTFGVRAESMSQDLSEPDASRKIEDELSRRQIAVQFLVNNAGFGAYGAFSEVEMDSQVAMVQVNALALMELTRLVLPSMLARKSGRILNVGSAAGFQPGPYMAIYYATKAFVLSFSEALDSELAGTGVSCTVLCPGPVETEFQKRAGLENSRLFKSNVMKSNDVARIGYEAMLRGRRLVVPGWKSRAMIFAERFVPRNLVTATTRRLNSGRRPA